MGQLVFCEGGARNPEVNSLSKVPMSITVQSDASVLMGSLRSSMLLTESISEDGWVNRNHGTLAAQSTVSTVAKSH